MRRIECQQLHEPGRRGKRPLAVDEIRVASTGQGGRRVLGDARFEMVGTFYDDDLCGVVTRDEGIATVSDADDRRTVLG